MSDEDGFDPRWNGKSIPKNHWHFHRQLLARYGIVLAPGEFSKMLDDIAKGRAKLIMQKAPTTAIYAIKNTRLWEWYYVLIREGYVVTALPPNKRYNRIRKMMTF